MNRAEFVEIIEGLKSFEDSSLSEIIEISESFLEAADDEDLFEEVWADEKAREGLMVAVDAYNDRTKAEKPKKEPMAKTKAEKPKKEPMAKTKAEKPKKEPKAKVFIAEWEGNMQPYPTSEVSLLNRFVKFNGKTVSDITSSKTNNPKSLLNSLQSAIISKKIRKSSDFADEIMEMQKMLIKLNTDIDQKKITGKDVIEIENADKMKEKLSSYKVGDLSKLSKRFVSRAQYKEGRKEEAEKILKKLKELPINEAYEDERSAMVSILEDYVDGKISSIDVVSRQLRGLGRQCCGLGNVADENGIVSSEDMVKATFDSAGFTGRWSSFFGNPSSNFKIMVYGAAGGGKSTFCILLAKYLTEHLGWRVLYIASEERFGYTLKEKLKRLNACNENLHIAERVPDGVLKDYDCVFFDSVNDLQIEPSELNDYTDGIASVSIFQCTKDGQYKGGQEFSHDADVVVRVDDMVAVTEKNRFGNSGNEFVVG